MLGLEHCSALLEEKIHRAKGLICCLSLSIGSDNIKLSIQATSTNLLYHQKMTLKWTESSKNAIQVYNSNFYCFVILNFPFNHLKSSKFIYKVLFCLNKRFLFEYKSLKIRYKNSNFVQKSTNYAPKSFFIMFTGWRLVEKEKISLGENLVVGWISPTHQIGRR